MMHKISFHFFTPNLLIRLLMEFRYITKYCLITVIILGTEAVCVSHCECKVFSFVPLVCGKVSFDFQVYLDKFVLERRGVSIMYVYLKYDKGITVRMCPQRLLVNQFYKIGLRIIFLSSFKSNLNSLANVKSSQPNFVTSNSVRINLQDFKFSQRQL